MNNSRRTFLSSIGIGIIACTPVIPKLPVEPLTYQRGPGGWIKMPGIIPCPPSEVLDAIGLKEYQRLINDERKS